MKHSMINGQVVVRETGRANGRRGYTLVEVAVSTLIMGVLVVGALNVVGSSVKTQRVAATGLDAPALGHQLMAEILALPYEDPDEPTTSIGLDTGESNITRVDFDDLDDYDGWSRIPPEAKDGTPLPNVSDWQRQAAVQYFDPSTGGTTPTDTGVKLITVTIVPPTGLNFELNALRSKWGALQQSSPIDATLVTSLDGELQIGSTGRPAQSATLLQNHANDP